MNAEQLKSARLARWSQNGEARLTLESATEWLDTIGFCPYLPLAAVGSTPAASFLEAVVGRPAHSPSAGERSRAQELLARMVENSAAAPLKLGSSLGEQPDFVASPEVLRYIYALRGDRTWKTGPSTVGNEKVTPLALHCWQAIEQQGALDVPALQPILGRDITEAAIARALQELWIGLYVYPKSSATGKPAKWELFSRGFPGQITAGASTGHAESQSAMVSIYLHAVVAAAEEEVLAFLSPLAPQSKLREVIRGLGSMRQLDIIDIAGRAHVCLQGGLLPEMVAQLSEEQLGVARVEAEAVESRPVETGIAEGGIQIEREPARLAFGDSPEQAKKFVPKKFEPKKFEPKKFEPKKFAAREFVSRGSSGKEGAKKSFGARPDRGGSARSTGSRPAGSFSPRPRSIAASGSDVPAYMGKGSKGSGYKEAPYPGNKEAPYRGRGFAKYAADAEKPATRGLGERARRWEKSGEGEGAPPPANAGDRPFKPRTSYEPRVPHEPRASFKPSGGNFKSAGSKPGGFKAAKPWASKSGGPDGGGKPWARRAAFPERTARPRGSEERGDTAAEPSARSRKPFAAKTSGFKPGGFKASGFKPQGASGFKPQGATQAGAKPWASKSAAPRAGGAKPWTARKPENPAGAEGRGGEALGRENRPARWEKSGPHGRPGASSGGFQARPAGRKPWDAKPSAQRAPGSKPAGRKPSGFTSSGFKSAGKRAAESRSDGPKPWLSKGAESRVGSAKSYAARNSQVGDKARPRSVGKSYAKPDGGKPGTKRDSSASFTEGKPRRREKPESAAGEKSGDQGAKKPFWAKNPRGGKGSAAASRTNRPRGKKAGDKKAGKKKSGKKK